MLYPSRPLMRVLLALVLVSSIIGILSLRVPLRKPIPYAEEWEEELKASEGSTFLRRQKASFGSRSQADDTGQDRMLQQFLMNYHLAFESNRSLVYPSLPVEDEEDTSKWFPRPRPTKVPMSAYIGSVVSGFEALSDRPKAVSFTQYRKVCSKDEEAVYRVSMTTKDGNVIATGSGVATSYTHAELMNVTARCLHVQGEIFDQKYLKTSHSLTLAPALIEHPTLRYFTFARSVLSLVNDMMPTLAKAYPKYNLDLHATAKGLQKTDPFKHILVLDLQHGEQWLERCTQAGLANEPFLAFNRLPNHPGNENVPPPPETVEATRLGVYVAKCRPDYTAIVHRARRMRKNHPLLRTIYLLPNPARESSFVEDVRRWLLSDAWNEVYAGAGDFGIDGIERAGVDMEIARRAGVFVGNGFSETASVVALLRARDGVHPDLTQYW